MPYFSSIGNQPIDFKWFSLYTILMYDFLLTVFRRRSTMTPLDNIDGSTAQLIDTYPTH
jgi:hypothetical protein